MRQLGGVRAARLHARIDIDVCRTRPFPCSPCVASLISCCQAEGQTWRGPRSCQSSVRPVSRRKNNMSKIVLATCCNSQRASKGSCNNNNNRNTQVVWGAATTTTTTMRGVGEVHAPRCIINAAIARVLHIEPTYWYCCCCCCCRCQDCTISELVCQSACLSVSPLYCLCLRTCLHPLREPKTQVNINLHNCAAVGPT